MDLPCHICQHMFHQRNDHVKVLVVLIEVSLQKRTEKSSDAWKITKQLLLQNLCSKWVAKNIIYFFARYHDENNEYINMIIAGYETWWDNSNKLSLFPKTWRWTSKKLDYINLSHTMTSITIPISYDEKYLNLCRIFYNKSFLVIMLYFIFRATGNLFLYHPRIILMYTVYTIMLCLSSQKSI